MFGLCENKKNLSIIDLYLINDYDGFKAQCSHIKKCYSSKIRRSKTGTLIKEEKGEVIIYLFKYDGLHSIANICDNFYIL